MAGDDRALTDDQLRGLLVFINQGLPDQVANPLFAAVGKGNCAACHVGAELTAASVTNVAGKPTPVFDVSPTLVDGRLAPGTTENRLLDEGFFNIGVRPTGEDPGRGGTELGQPLSWAKQAQMGLFGIALPAGSTTTTDAAGVDGAFKTPGLRNVELTGPYFHTGGQGTLLQVVQFYQRQGDFSNVNIASLYDDLSDVSFTSADEEPLVAFLMSLTDERVRDERAPFDHPQLFVPNGHPGDSNAITRFSTIDGVKVAADAMIEVPAVGSNGKPARVADWSLTRAFLIGGMGASAIVMVLLIARARKTKREYP